MDTLIDQDAIKVAEEERGTRQEVICLYAILSTALKVLLLPFLKHIVQV